MVSSRLYFDNHSPTFYNCNLFDECRPLYTPFSLDFTSNNKSWNILQFWLSSLSLPRFEISYSINGKNYLKFFRQLTTWMFVELKIKTCHCRSFFIIFNWFSQNRVQPIKNRKLGFTGQDSVGRRSPHRPGFWNSLFPSRASWFPKAIAKTRVSTTTKGRERGAQRFRTARTSTEPCYRVRLGFWSSFGKVEFIENWIGKISLVLFTSGERKSFRNKYFQPRKSKRSWNE